MKRNLLTYMLTLILLAGIPIQAMAKEQLPEQPPIPQTISIRTTEEFLSFSQSCSLDSWSQNKQFVLEADISLEEVDFAPIATFGGSFDGCGHTISGLNITQSVTPAGLFGILQPTATVKNLHVQGTVVPGGDCSATGGIAGENHGGVENCTFSGTVTGQRNTGGIAGSNWGTISDCSAAGSITGDNRTGGIAGYNNGTIHSCINEMAVNTESVDPTISPSQVKWNFNLDFSKASELDVSDAASDTGGIAGYSSGSIADCENTGSIGYPHIGYNLGGIVGRNCGFVENCENKGSLAGRKDVGGIVGQIEPHIQTILSPDYLETLSRQFENLGGLVSAAGSHGSEMGGNVQDSIETITGYRSSAQSAVGALVQGAENGELDKGALSSLGSAIQGMVNASGGLNTAIGDGVEDLTGDISAIAGQIRSISRTFALATEDVKQETVTDLSDVDAADILEGRVLRCINTGSVEADINVGGITGIMALESTADPEDDAPGGSTFQRRRYELKAIVDDCENMGTVTGKRSYVGGICGRMELGLIQKSRGYGSITSENGDYVGGIAGLAGGTVRDCFAKCTLSGGSYIGGIVGSGIDQDINGDSSTVTGCYSMVDIPEYKQYAGAVSGVYAGVYTGNYFVSDTLAGINRVSYYALAEPVTYEKMQTIQSLPQNLRELTLRFVADGVTVKSLPFRYGDSFDDSVFPEIPQKEGCYAKWSTRDLNNLRFDTVVQADYLPYITALQSQQTRPADRPVFFVEGRFQEGDALSVTRGKTTYHTTEDMTLLEQWTLCIPADGLESHTIRYLPTQENVQLYLLKSGSWTRIQPEDMGTYLALEASGAEVEIAVVKASPAGRNRLVGAAGILVIVILLAWVILKGKKAKKGQTEVPQKGKKRRFLLLLVLLAMGAAMAAVLYLPGTEAVQTVQAYDILKQYLEQPQREMQLTVKAQVENKNADFSAQISITKLSDTTVTRIQEGERQLYYADGVVFLENGDAFRLNAGAPDYSRLLDQLLELWQSVQIDSTDGIYTLTADGPQAGGMVKLLMPTVQSLLPQTNRLTIDLITQNDELQQIRFTGAGNLTDSVKMPFSLSATLDVLPASGVQLPQGVAQAILSGNYHPQEIYSDDLIRLMDAWAQIRSRNPITAQFSVEADCGVLSVRDSFRYNQWKVEDAVIHGVEKNGQTLYFSEGAVCNAKGKGVSGTTAEELEITELMDTLYKTFKSAQFQCRREDVTSVYTVALEPDGIRQLGETILPKTKNMDILYDSGSIQLRLADGQIQYVDVQCGGSSKVGLLTPDVRFVVKIQFLEGETGDCVPDAVVEKLCK